MEFFHSKDLHKLDNGKPFDITFIKNNGEEIAVHGAVMTSFFSSGLTMNIKFPGYNHPVKLRRSQVIAINNKELIV